MFTREKVAQAIQLLPKHGLDLWITLCRETSHMKDPALSLIYTGDAVWLSAFLIAKNGENIALVGTHDVDGILQRGEFDTVIGYDADFQKPFLELLNRQNPERIGLNYSIDDTAADGMTYGLWLHLQDLLKDTPYKDRLVSAAPLIGELRGVKTSGEVSTIRRSTACAEEIIAGAGAHLCAGLSEYEIAQLFKAGMKQRGVIEAWSAEGCPAVNCGPDSAVGHALPSPEIILEPGQIVHIDFGVILDNYASDLQRVWYLPKPGETAAPDEVLAAFAVVREAIVKAAHYLKPGVLGHEVDRVARDTIIHAGYPEYMHALGHQVGQKAHDGGSLLAPLWPRYGDSNKEQIQRGNVFTLELGVPTSAGYIGLEEMVVVTETGCEFISTPQTEVWVLPRR